MSETRSQGERVAVLVNLLALLRFWIYFYRVSYENTLEPSSRTEKKKGEIQQVLLMYKAAASRPFFFSEKSISKFQWTHLKIIKYKEDLKKMAIIKVLSRNVRARSLSATLLVLLNFEHYGNIALYNDYFILLITST